MPIASAAVLSPRAAAFAVTGHRPRKRSAASVAEIRQCANRIIRLHGITTTTSPAPSHRRRSSLDRPRRLHFILCAWRAPQRLRLRADQGLLHRRRLAGHRQPDGRLRRRRAPRRPRTDGGGRRRSRARRLIMRSPTPRLPCWRTPIARPEPRCSTSPSRLGRRRRKSERRVGDSVTGWRSRERLSAARRGEYRHGNRRSEDHSQRFARHPLQQAGAQPVQRAPGEGRRLDRGACRGHCPALRSCRA